MTRPRAGSARVTPPGWRTARAGLAAAALLGALLAGDAAAQSKTGTTFGQFLLIEPSARFTALGNAGVALDPGLDAVYYNPAGAARLEGVTIELSHVDWFAGIRHDYVAMAIPLGRWGTTFGTVVSLNSGDIDVRTVDQPLGTGQRYSVSNVAIGLGYSHAITERFAGGVQVRYVQESIWNTSARTVTFDVGSLYRIHPLGLHLGASLTNFGTSAGFSGRDLRITYDDDPTREGDNGTLPGERYTQDYPVPVLFRVGVAYPYQLRPEWRLWTGISASHPSDNSESVGGGVELRYRNLVSVRAGYQSLFKQDSEEGPAAGAGLHGRLQGFDYRVDYGWADHGRLHDVHRVSLALLF